VAPARTASATDPPLGEGRSFKGWRPEVVEFFDELEMDNTKSYWTAHKEFYMTDVLGPMQALLVEMAPEFGEGRVFRPYRDTRFSPDKSPYKTNIAAHNDAGYISLSSDALGVGSGLWMPAPAQLTRYRAAVADEKRGAELARILSGLRRKRMQVSAHETLKSAPRGYPNDHPRIELLRFKGLTAWKEWPVGAWLGTAASKRRIIEVLRASAPLRKWLDSNVGTAEGP
jgi:uncharacterized protein (TIGR02453 family)